LLWLAVFDAMMLFGSKFGLLGNEEILEAFVSEVF